MLHRTLPFALLLPLCTAQIVHAAPDQPRYADFTVALGEPGAIVAVGTLGKWKEGTREPTQQVGSGPQFFRVPTTATLQPRVTLHGKPGNVELTIDLWIKRKPDGEEQRYIHNGGDVAENDLALCVVLPRAGKGLVLRQVIVFRPTDKGEAAEGLFLDAMRDYFAVNCRVKELHDALIAVERSKNDTARMGALRKLRNVVEKKVELRQAENDKVLVQHAGPLEQRAQQLLGERAKDGAPKPDTPK